MNSDNVVESMSSFALLVVCAFMYHFICFYFGSAFFWQNANTNVGLLFFGFGLPCSLSLFISVEWVLQFVSFYYFRLCFCCCCGVLCRKCILLYLQESLYVFDDILCDFSVQKMEILLMRNNFRQSKRKPSDSNEHGYEVVWHASLSLDLTKLPASQAHCMCVIDAANLQATEHMSFSRKKEKKRRSISR